MLVTFRSEQQTASYQLGIIRKAITTCYLFVGREAAHHSIMMEKNRMQFFREIMNFLDERDPQDVN